MALPNPGMDAVPFTPLTAEFLDDMIENIESLADGSGLNTSAVTSDKIDFTTFGEWQTLTSFEPGWQVSGLSGGVVKYRKLGQEVKMIGGAMVISGTIPSGTNTVMTLPAGFRPQQTLYFQLRTNAGATLGCLVDSSGRIRTDSNAANTPNDATYVMFNNISFMTA